MNIQSNFGVKREGMRSITSLQLTRKMEKVVSSQGEVGVPAANGFNAFWA